MQRQPWVPKELLPYSRARKVLGVMVAGEPTADQYLNLARRKVVDLIAKAPDLYPIETFLNLPLNHLNDPTDPEVVYQDLEDLAPEWRIPIHDLSMHLQGKGTLQEVKGSLNLAGESKELGNFRKELENLTLEEFLELATTM